MKVAVVCVLPFDVVNFFVYDVKRCIAERYIWIQLFWGTAKNVILIRAILDNTNIIKGASLLFCDPKGV